MRGDAGGHRHVQHDQVAHVSRVTCQLSSRVTCQVVEPARAVSAAGPTQGGVRAGRRQGAVRPPALPHGQVRRSDK